MNLGIKIKALREQRGLTQIELANLSNTSRASIQLYEADKVNIPVKNLEKIAKALNVNSDYFLSSNLSSKNENFVKQSVKQSQNLSSNKPLNTPNLKMSQDIINIPYFEDTYASAGSGIINYDETPIVMSFDINFLRVFLKITGSLNNLHIINAKGDSMEPTINGGELLYINPYENEQSVISGCIYVINYDGDIFVKRVDKNPVTKSLTLISDNPKYEPIKIEATDLINCKIIGRVVAHTSRI
ncbi:DNA-binding protein [Campylobacter hyointestinalis]|uniref:XRE family transcriptional regulator n=1 Tax=Campylobacter hyointestinalis TaxID=198 RepID=UPI000725B170|nr:XRE family transcriptional regulator [Campylobacter hyointestinalis]PPB55794.1 hypothetical protein CDQ67_04355 [Campylobacter hyointestinalis subsp. hyointestinalis]CUU77916.1 DNA-binding protein [Campylobacter hyointestinalis]